MCTVTYIPTGKDTYILTHNRDESIKRPLASPPVKRKLEEKFTVYPVDPVGMGTWVGFSDEGRVASLLNGGTERHEHNPPYRHSRGLVIPALFKYKSFIEFYTGFDFEGLEPFTLLVFEHGNIYELIHNENATRFQSLDSEKPFIYSSSTLYSDSRIQERKLKFLEWFFLTDQIDQQKILDLHRQFRFEKEADQSLIPAGHILKTVSITSVVKGNDKLRMDYFDVVNDIHLWKALDFTQTLSLDSEVFQGSE